MKADILVVDDDAAHRRMLEVVLTEQGRRVHQAPDGETAVAAVRERFFDLILMDIRMGGMDGISALEAIRRVSPAIPVILMTAYASVETAVSALKKGASDYITKPLNTDELGIIVEKALAHRRLERENRFLKQRLKDRYAFDRIIGGSPALAAVFDMMAQVAPTEATVLITGESGTGKELIANAIHANSPRSAGPFVAINCAALPEELLESELFGHEKGAFTGAVSSRRGRFQMAEGGSIFLDEIGEMRPRLQVKLLRVLQERSFEPVGASRSVSVDTRVLAATNRNLKDEIHAGRFREDLFYRLNVVNIHLPPLRERGEDILPLADHFLRKYAERNNRLIKGFAPRAVDILMRHDWPGNVRELENLVERAVILSRGERIGAGDLPPALRQAHETASDSIVDDGIDAAYPNGSGGRSLKEVEREMILRTLSETGGNRTQAADILGISRRTLQLKLKAYGVNP